MLVFEERGKPDYLEKNLLEQSREPTKLSPDMMPGRGIEPGTHWWKASALTTAPTLLPKVNDRLLQLIQFTHKVTSLLQA